jgi:hypothetical protein
MPVSRRRVFFKQHYQTQRRKGPALMAGPVAGQVRDRERDEDRASVRDSAAAPEAARINLATV